MEVAIDKTGSAVERRLIFVDKNRDMFMTQVRVYGMARKTVKLCRFSLCLYSHCATTHRCTPLPFQPFSESAVLFYVRQPGVVC